MFTKLAIWFLRKKKVSVMIGFTVNKGSIHSNYKDTYFYDNGMYGVDYYTCDDKLLKLPEGKFEIKQ